MCRIAVQCSRVNQRLRAGFTPPECRRPFQPTNGDLTADPAVIRNVTAVFKDGVGYDAAAMLRRRYGGGGAFVTEGSLS